MKRHSIVRFNFPGMRKLSLWVILGLLSCGLCWSGWSAAQAVIRTPKATAPKRAAPAAPTALMATVTVQSLGDGAANAANCPGVNCRLRDAIAAATAGDTVDFSVSGTITLTSGELGISKNLTIQGPGAAQLNISGNQASRVFNIGSGQTVSINDLKITNGVVDPTLGNGGGVINSGTLNLNQCDIASNSAYRGGGVYSQNLSTLNVRNSTLRDNTTGGGGGGGINCNKCTLNLINSTVSGNRGTSAAAGLMVWNGANALLANSTISGNLSDSGGGIYILSATVLARNTIIAGNTSSTLNPQVFSPDVLGGMTSLGNNVIGNNSNATITPDHGRFNWYQHHAHQSAAGSVGKLRRSDANAGTAAGQSSH